MKTPVFWVANKISLGLTTFRFNFLRTKMRENLSQQSLFQEKNNNINKTRTNKKSVKPFGWAAKQFLHSNTNFHVYLRQIFNQNVLIHRHSADATKLAGET